jgi:TolB-like protein
MTEPLPEAAEAEPRSKEQAAPAASEDLWQRVKEHKVLQWSLTYFGASLALAHAQDLLSHTYHWPEFVGRLLIGVLMVGFPIALAIAWYHGHKGLKQISAGEMTVISIMILIGAGLLVVLVRAPIEPAPPLQVHEGIPPPATSVANEVTAAKASAPETSPLPQVSVPQASIAVMPFVNLTGDAGKEYFSDGMAEELINLLAQVPGLKVPARTSSFAYKGRNVDIRHIAQDLGVATILEGSVRSAGQEIRVTAQLVNAQTGYHVWSQDYDRKLGDIFKLQDDLAGAIVQALQTNLNVNLPAATAQTAPTQDVEAYQLYLQARSVPNGSEQSFREAIALYDQALGRDPTFARALAGRAFIRATSVKLGYPLPLALADAERDAEQALALNPNLTQARMVLGITNASRGNWLKAEANFRAASASDPSDGEIRATHAITVLLSAGRLHQAHSEAIEAYRLAPASNYVVMVLAFADWGMGLDEDARRFANLGLELGASPLLIKSTNFSEAVHQGRYAEAADRAIELTPADIRGAGGAEVIKLAYGAQADPRQQPAARQAVRGFAQQLKSHNIDVATMGIFVTTFTLLKALDSAYGVANQALDESVRSGTISGGWGVLWRPELQPFRKDPRFQTLVTRMGLMDYWKQYGPPDDCDLKDGRLTCR